MSDSVRPHRRQPTRLPCPWDSPGKNTGVGCHFLLQGRKVKSESEVAQSYLTFSDPMVYSLPGSSAHGIFQARVLEWGAIAFSENIENYKILMKEIKKDTNRWRNIPCSCIRRINIVKMSNYPKQSVDSMQSLSSYQWYFFRELGQIILQFVWKHKKP